MKLKKLANSVFSCGVMLSVLATQAHAQHAPLPESDGATFGYQDAATAFEALSEKEGVSWRIENGWPIATDEAEMTVWSFAPPGYPAYPAVVKRQIVAQGKGSNIVMSVRCEAGKAVCDELVRTFAEMNGMKLQD